MAKIKVIGLFLLESLLSLTTPLSAQQNEKNNLPADSINLVIDSLMEITSFMAVTASYISRDLLLGRDFKERQFDAGPTLLYKWRKGFYLYADGEYWSAIPNVVSFVDLGTGYERQITNRLLLSADYERWLLFHQDDYTRHALNNNIETYLNFDLTLCNIETSFHYMFGSQWIFQSDILISKKYFLCPVLKTGNLFLDPKILLSFANQDFILIYGNYPHGFISANKIKPVDIELQLPLSAKFGNLTIRATAYYNVPLKIGKEDINPFIYFALNLSRDFYFDKGRIHSLMKTREALLK